MRLVPFRTRCLLLREDGTVCFPMSKFIYESYINPHTRVQAAQALKIFYRFCCANKIELALLSNQSRCITYEEVRGLIALCHRPLVEIDNLSENRIISLMGVMKKRAPLEIPNTVSAQTAFKRIVHICKYLNFYRSVFLDPKINSISAREQLHLSYKTVEEQLLQAIRGTKQGHHHQIRSLPSAKFLEIIRQVFLAPNQIFCTPSGSVSRNLLRDRAIFLLGCEGLRPGSIGNIRRDDFRHQTNHLVITDNRSKRMERSTTGTPVLKMGASTLMNSASETMIKLWPITVIAIQEYIDQERTHNISRRLMNPSNGFLFLNQQAGPLKNRSTFTNIFNRAGILLAKFGHLDVGDDPYFYKKKEYDFYGYVLRHSSANLYLEQKGTSDKVLDSMKARFGWTMNSKQPDRYAARAFSDQSNVDLMKFNSDLLNDLHSKIERSDW